MLQSFFSASVVGRAKMDIESLVAEIFTRPALWDKSDKNHHNRFVLDKLWLEVAQELNTKRK
jgi:hypothetical protein